VRVSPRSAGYALLVAPSSNRVYAGEAARLTLAELSAFGEAVLSSPPRKLDRLELGGVEYVGFQTEAPLNDRDLAYLSRVSTAYALFEVDGDWLRPVRLAPLDRYQDDLVTIPKYPGKTNEQFTQLLLNVTVLASQRARRLLDDRLVVLDPLCGRGTTLNQALRYGYDAIGIESDGSHVDAYSAFLRTWLRRKRLKHKVELHPVRHDGRRVARRLTATLAPTREAHRAGDIQQLTVLHADTARARELLRPGCCDVIVTDAPYGVVHGSGAAELLAAAVPGWAELLRRGGALGISFNTHTTDRGELADRLTATGLTVAPDRGLTHWVDQGITRDLVVAVKPDR
jgi:SAM-dependent methyltransferase